MADNGNDKHQGYSQGGQKKRNFPPRQQGRPNKRRPQGQGQGGPRKPPVLDVANEPMPEISPDGPEVSITAMKIGRAHV